MPKRIQMSRQHPWRAENPDAVIVARPSKWGNPFNWTDIGAGFTVNHPDQNIVSVYLTMDPATARELAVLQFAQALDGTYRPGSMADYPTRDEIRAELAGKDLACWCPIYVAVDGEPKVDTCHADVLLEIANVEVAS